MSNHQFDPAHAMALHDRLMWMAKDWPLKMSADEIAAKTDELRNYLNKFNPAAVREAALEEAAKVCDDLCAPLDPHKWPSALAAASAIRALKNAPDADR